MILIVATYMRYRQTDNDRRHVVSKNSTLRVDQKVKLNRSAGRPIFFSLQSIMSGWFLRQTDSDTCSTP